VVPDVVGSKKTAAEIHRISAPVRAGAVPEVAGTGTCDAHPDEISGRTEKTSAAFAPSGGDIASAGASLDARGKSRDKVREGSLDASHKFSAAQFECAPEASKLPLPSWVAHLPVPPSPKISQAKANTKGGAKGAGGGSDKDGDKGGKNKGGDKGGETPRTEKKQSRNRKKKDKQKQGAKNGILPEHQRDAEKEAEQDIRKARENAAKIQREQQKHLQKERQREVLEKTL
jgi:hypothetical protein